MNSLVLNDLPADRLSLLRLEEAMKAFPLSEQMTEEERTFHYFAPGLYAREFLMDAGEACVGKIHKHEHLAMLVYGKVTISDEFDNKTIEGPFVFVSEAGVKRAVFAHTDCMFMTFHPTDKVELKEIEEEVIAPSYEAYDTFYLENKV